MTTLAFVLSMPGVGSWNGKWTGASYVHAIVKNLGTSKRAADKASALVGSYGYDFGDGWTARVTVSEVDAQVARSLRKRSRGFAGYGWMVDEILANGIIAPREARS